MDKPECQGLQTDPLIAGSPHFGEFYLRDLYQILMVCLREIFSDSYSWGKGKGTTFYYLKGTIK